MIGQARAEVAMTGFEVRQALQEFLAKKYAMPVVVKSGGVRIAFEENREAKVKIEFNLADSPIKPGFVPAFIPSEQA